MNGRRKAEIRRLNRTAAAFEPTPLMAELRAVAPADLPDERNTSVTIPAAHLLELADEPPSPDQQARLRNTMAALLAEAPRCPHVMADITITPWVSAWDEDPTARCSNCAWAAAPPTAPVCTRCEAATSVDLRPYVAGRFVVVAALCGPCLQLEVSP